MRWSIFLTYLIFCMFTFYGLCYYHELVHVEIFKSYGIEAEIDMFSEFPDAVTYYKPTEENRCNENCKLTNNINEVVGYHLVWFMIFFQIVFGIIFLLIDLNLLRRSIKENGAS
ncbi:MAG: hypothetical protein ACOCRX_04125 [Candidatus Woesearchaeota archaeon]